MFQVFFFSQFLAKFLQKLFQFVFLFFYKFTKIKAKSFECPKSIRNYEKDNALNIRRLVDESFVPATQRTSVLYCRLSDFKLPLQIEKKSHLQMAKRFYIWKLSLVISAVISTFVIICRRNGFSLKYHSSSVILLKVPASTSM